MKKTIRLSSLANIILHELQDDVRNDRLVPTNATFEECFDIPESLITEI